MKSTVDSLLKEFPAFFKFEEINKCFIKNTNLEKVVVIGRFLELVLGMGPCRSVSL